VVRDTMPFLLAMVVALGILTFVPELTLWLPRQLGYQG
jgi:C4-dicarboxylate transporter DctM subunit